MRRAKTASRVGSIGVVVFAVVSLAVWLAIRETSERIPDRDIQGRVTSGPRSDPVSHPIGSGPPAVPSVSGLVTRAGRPVSLPVEIRRISDPRPPGHEIPARLLISPAGEFEDRTTSGADGRFVLAVRRAGLYRLAVRIENGAEASRVVSIPAPGERIRVSLDVPHGEHVLRGTAAFADGRPFRGRIGAFLTRVSYRLAGVMAIWAETTEDGGFAIPALHAGEIVLAASSRGFARVGATVRVPSSEPVRFVVDGGWNSVRGRVIADEDDHPVAGAEVRVESGGNASAVARTDEAGRFVLPAWRTLELTVTAPGYAVFRVEWTAIEDADEVEIRLVRPLRIRGRVVGLDDDPVAGVDVVARPLERTRTVVRTTSAGDGRFELTGLVPGDVVVFAHGESFLSERLGAVAAGRGSGLVVSLRAGETPDVTVRVVPAARARGRVVRASGEGAAGVLVRVADVDARGRDGGWLPAVDTVTDENGDFTCGGLAPDVSYRATARPGRRDHASSGIRLARADRPIEFEIEAPPERRLRVTVIDATTNLPVHGATIRIAGKGERLRVDGTVTIEALPAGPLDVVVSHPDYISRTKVAGSDGDVSELEVTVALTPGVAVTGRVLEPDGTPVPLATITFGAVVKPSGVRGGARVRADRDGAFRAMLLPGRHRVLVSPYWPLEPIVPASGPEVDAGPGEIVLVLPEPVSLPPTGELVVRILDADGRPVPFGRVGFRMTRGATSMSSERDFAAGRVALEMREFDEISVEVLSAWSAPGRALDVGSGTLGPLPMRPEEHLIRLTSGGTVSGSVTDLDGTPVAGVVVRASPCESHRDYPLVASTDAGGLFVLRGIGAREHEIRVMAPLDRAAPSSVRARAGASGLRFALRPAVGVTIEVVDEAGRPVVGAYVSAHNTEDRRRVVRVRTGADGMARLEPLYPGAIFRFNVAPPDGVPLSRWEAEEWRPRDERVVLRPTRRLSGVVLDGAGEVVPRARVVLEGPGGSPGDRTTADEQGQFVFENASPDRLTLRAYPPGAWRLEWDAPALVAEPGDREVTLRVARSGSIRIRIVSPPAERLFAVLSAEPIGEKTHAWRREIVDGTGVFRHLVPGRRYELHLGPTGSGLTAHREGLEPGSEVTVVLEPGLEVSGRLEVPEGSKDIRVWARRAGSRVRGTVGGGQYEIRGLAPGFWTVHAAVALDGAFRQTSGDVAAGARLDLVIPAR